MQSNFYSEHAKTEQEKSKDLDARISSGGSVFYEPYDAWRSLICSMVEQAIYDYKVLAAAGIVLHGDYVQGTLPCKYKFLGGYSTEVSVRTLIEFLSPETKQLEIIFEIANIEICPTRTRKALNWFREEL